MPPKAIIGATVAAIVGALVWGAVSYFTNYEVGYVAWGIGLLVGGAATALGGHGRVSGGVAVVLALGAMFLGKVFAVQWSAPSHLRTALEQFATPELYERQTKAAEAFAQVTSAADHPAFMLAQGFTEAEDAAAVTAEELADFREEAVPGLKRMYDQKPDYETWRQKFISKATDRVAGAMPVARMVVEDLGAMDVIFALLGIATAWRLGSGSTA